MCINDQKKIKDKKEEFFVLEKKKVKKSEINNKRYVTIK